MVSVVVMVDSCELDFLAAQRLASPAASAFEDGENGGKDGLAPLLEMSEGRRNHMVVYSPARVLLYVGCYCCVATPNRSEDRTKNIEKKFVRSSVLR